MVYESEVISDVVFFGGGVNVGVVVGDGIEVVV